MKKTIVITGGANGIGRCAVETFARKQNRVYFIDKDADAATWLADKLQNEGCYVTAFVGDVADKQTLIKFSELVIGENPGGINWLINNACAMQGGILSGCDYDDFLYTQQVGVAAPYMLSKLFKDHFNGVGSIVNISSTRAFQSQPNTESYTAAKGGITALTHAMSVSLSGVARVNAISPGWIETSAYHTGGNVSAYSQGDVMQHPSQRVGIPQDIVQAIEFLSDERNSFINGQNIIIDGGMSKLMIYHADCGWEFKGE